ncbi:S9 family peptidase [Ferruginibacter sp. SUN106]|uniref:S9 family peptidase n=1 Tax=Ferruginibacter sp. SUN106 TaxID=2978348 RepID=UPI003D364FE9
MKFRIIALSLFFVFAVHLVPAQRRVNWTPDGNAYTKIKEGSIVKVDAKTDAETVLIKKEQLTPTGGKALFPQSYAFSSDNSKLLIFTNTAKVWRLNTRGDYWILDIASNKLTQLGKGRPGQSLMFAKFSPDGKKVGYVSEHNLYVEEVATNIIKRLTADGTRKLINGTFDWVYEEEFGCRDGFRWSPDGTKIAFWQVDATKIRDYYMLNTTDSNYSHVIPVEYPKVGEAPSPVKIGVAEVNSGTIRWMQIEGDPQQHYLPRMEWTGNNELMVQQLDRKQQESKLMYCNTNDGSARTFWAENDEAWVDLNSADIFGEPGGFSFVNKGQDFIWISEKDGWRHIYKISRDGKTETLITKGNYDIESIKCIDEANNLIYFTASPTNATQLYLYKIRIENKAGLLDKFKKVKEDAELVSAENLVGTHSYNISPNGKFATHSFSNYNTPPVREWITLPDNKPVNAAKSIAATIKTDNENDVEYMQITTEDNVTVDAWINKPKNFDPSKKYPVIMEVYGEPAASTVQNSYGAHSNGLYNGDIRADGYIQVSVDNRGTPMLKGAKWRKAIYRKIGVINIRDQAMAMKKLLEARPYMDKDRVAVWGWSGGGSSTLNLMFQYPEIFKTGISVAAVGNQLNYDNIYQERYMGLPQENMQDFVNGSPITHAKNLKGNLLYIHGTGDDNVHYDNAEQLLNELIKYNKQFQFMPYPNRTHSISEGEGTSLHLATLYTAYLRAHCEPGAK